MKKELFTLLTLLLCVCSGNAQTFWKVASTTVVTASQTFMDDTNLTVTNPFATTLKSDEQTFAGQSFTHYIQVRVETDPSVETPTGTERSGSTSLVITSKVKGTLVVYYRRQSTAQTDNKGTYADSDGKDLKVYMQTNASVVNGTLTVDKETDDGKYGWCTKEVELEESTTYTLAARGTTINFYGFSFTPSTPKTTTTKNVEATGKHAYLDNAGSISDDKKTISFSSYPMTIEGENIQAGNAQYQFTVSSNGKNYTGVKFAAGKTYIVTPATGITITNIKAYGSSNSSSAATITSGEENSIDLAARGTKDTPVVMTPLTLQTNAEGKYFFTIGGAQSIIVLDVTYDIAENVDITVSSAGYATLYYDKNLIIPDGVTAYVGKLEGDKMKMTEISDVIPANTGVILEASEGKYNFIITTGDAAAVTSDLTGTTTGLDVAANTVYTLGQNNEGVVGLRLYSGTTIRAYSAYYDSSTSGRSFIGIDFNDNTTGISNITPSNEQINTKKYLKNGRLVIEKNNTIYNISGIQVKYY